jgi:hypothetical protein
MLAWEFDDYSMSENLIKSSEDLIIAVGLWTEIGDGVTVTTNQVTAPDGTLSADKVAIKNTNSGFKSIQSSILSASVIGQAYTASIFCKAAEHSYVRIDMEGGGNSGGIAVDLTNGSLITQISAPDSYSIRAYPNGWYRIAATSTASSTAASALRVYLTNASGTAAFSGTTGNGVYLWGGQYESSSSVTDYTPTTTTAKTRVLSSTTNTNITGLGTYYSSGFDENVGFTTFLPANISPPYDPVYDEFGGTFFGAGQGRYMRQYNDKSVIVYNEIDEITDFYGRGVVRDGLVLDLDAGVSASYAGIGTTWTDLSTTSSQVILQNSPTFLTDNSGILDFDGTDDYADATSSAYNLGVGSIEVWVKADAPTDNLNQQIFARTNTSAGTFNIFKNAANLFQFSIRLTTNTQYNIGSDSTATNNWTHIVGTYDGAIQKMFVNTTQQSTTNAISGTLNISGTLAINIARQTTGTAIFNGKIAMVKLYNRALTTSEIQQNYNALKNRFGL